MKLNEKMEIFQAQRLITSQHNKELVRIKEGLTDVLIHSTINPKYNLRIKISSDGKVMVFADYQQMPLDVFIEMADLLKAEL